MRILVTNDDGIDSVGLHELARALTGLGEVVICAPDTEYSGAGASVGALNIVKPELHAAQVEGIDEAWTISGAPALCVLFVGLGALGNEPFDFVVSGINPGANVGGAVYHSGTVGAALTARQGGITGIAVSQSVTRGSRLGQGVEEGLEAQRWHSAGAVAASVVADLISAPLPEARALNVNVPNLDLADIKGWVHASVATNPLGSLSELERTPKPGHEGAYRLKMVWKGHRPGTADPSTDVGAVAAGNVALSWLGGLGDVAGHDVSSIGASIDSLLATTD